MRGRRSVGGACALAGLLFGGSPAIAGPTIITTRPVSADGGKIEFLVGGIDEGGRSLSSSGLEVAVDGQPAAIGSVQSLSDWATAASEASPTWHPPLAVGLVYLWVDGVPAGVLDGIHAFFQRIPSRTVVYPTIYGRLRQGRARLTAGDISRLDEIPYLEGYRPNLIEAIRLNLADLAGDPAPLKILLVVTDGRDFADPKGEGPGDFAALGAELRKAGITVLVSRFRPEADAEQAAANLRDLREATGGFLSAHDQPEELENTLESLGQSVADLERVELATPWTWRLLGSTHRLSVHFATANGERLTAEVGAVTFGAGLARSIFAVLALVSVILLAGAAVVKLRGRKGSDSAPRLDALLASAHNMIRRGASPERAAEELTRDHPEAADLLVNMDEGLMSDPRFPYLRTRPGRKRMKEIREILKRRQGDRPSLSDVMARVLAEGVTGNLSAPAVAQKLSALTGSEERAAFAALDLERLAEALRAVASVHPVLGTPRARGVVVSIQDALRSDESRTFGVCVGWLVRAGGPGRRGETLKLGNERNVIGQGAACGIQITGDPAVAPAHAAISMENGEFSIEPVGGPVKVEGETVSARRALVDGETIELGGGIYVYKVASV
ncbi:MAG TPA: FHA domain-containing protein [Polyangia bacterium]|nr:FHA domain-containing protein [Polyangia bacterium]